LKARPAVAVARAIRDELDGVPRSDGSPARITDETHRRELAGHVLKKLQPRAWKKKRTRKR
jgi:hypothetical protein